MSQSEKAPDVWHEKEERTPNGLPVGQCPHANLRQLVQQGTSISLFPAASRPSVPAPASCHLALYLQSKQFLPPRLSESELSLRG